MAARITHSARSPLANGFSTTAVLGSNNNGGNNPVEPSDTTQQRRRYRALSQTRVPYTSGYSPSVTATTSNTIRSSRNNTRGTNNSTPVKVRSVSVHRAPQRITRSTNLTGIASSAVGGRGVAGSGWGSGFSSVSSAAAAFRNAGSAVAASPAKQVATPVRPNRGPIITPNRKASAPPRLLTSHASEQQQQLPGTVTVRRRPTPHSNVVLSSTNFTLVPSANGSNHSSNNSNSNQSKNSDRKHPQHVSLDQSHSSDNSCSSSSSSCGSNKSNNSSESTGSSIKSTSSSYASSSGSNASSNSANAGSSLTQITRSNHFNSNNRRTPNTVTISSRTRKITAPLAASSCTTNNNNINKNKDYVTIRSTPHGTNSSSRSISQPSNCFYISEEADLRLNNLNVLSKNNNNLVASADKKTFDNNNIVIDNSDKKNFDNNLVITKLKKFESNIFRHHENKKCIREQVPPVTRTVTTEVTNDNDCYIKYPFNNDYGSPVTCFPTYLPYSPSLSPIHSLDKSNFEHEAGFLDDLPGGVINSFNCSVDAGPAAAAGITGGGSKHFANRISKDHGGGSGSGKSNLVVYDQQLYPEGTSSSAHSTPTEGRKLSVPAAPSSGLLSITVPSKRGHHSRESSNSDQQQTFLPNARGGNSLVPTSTRDDKLTGKPIKYKKLSNVSAPDKSDLHEIVTESNEAMDVGSHPANSSTAPCCTVQTVTVPILAKETMASLKSSVPKNVGSKMTGSPKSSSKEDLDVISNYKNDSSKSSNSSGTSHISATITINSIVPELSSIATPAVDSNKHPAVEPIVPLCRDSQDVSDGSKKHYLLKSSAMGDASASEPIKSVSITKLEIDTVIGNENLGNNSNSSSVSKSPDEGNSAPVPGDQVVIAKVTAGSVQRKLSPSKNFHSTSAGLGCHLTSSSEHSRKTSSSNKKFKKDHLESEESCTDEDNGKFYKNKVGELEKTVSDLVKNAEIKKQEIAALKMEIKRLKEAARDRGHHSDDDPCNKKQGGGGCSATAATTADHTINSAATAATSSDNAADPAASAAVTQDRLESLVEENRALRTQLLLHLGGSLNSSGLSDQEKEAILKGGSWGERSTTGATIGDWDNKSSSSEVSVACLQDRIMQMEETHYCTDEELQATLQELDDLKEQVAESMAELQQMQEEKQVLLASLTQQTNYLSEAREQNMTLKQLLIQHSENSQTISNCVNSQKLLELLKSVEEDHERLEMKQEDVEAQLGAAKVAELRFLQDSQMYRDRMKSLEGLLECSAAGKAAADAQAAESQENLKAQRLENTRLQAAITTAKENIVELEARLVGGGSVGEVLEVVRAEKEKLELQFTELTQRHHTAACETDKLKEQLSVLQDKLKNAEMNARAGLTSASARSERLQEERRALLQQVASAEVALAEAKQTSQRHLQHKRELKTALSDVQKSLTQAHEAKQDTENTMHSQKQHFDKQVEEWEQFQCDLLTTVRVANEFKTEAQTQLDKIQQDNALLKQQVTSFEKKIAGCRVCTGMSSGTKSSNSPGSSTGIDSRRNPEKPLTRADSRVKSLIESLESGGPICGTRAGSRTSGICTIDGNSSITGSSGIAAVRKTAMPLLKRGDAEDVMLRSSGLSSSSPLKESGNIEPGSPVSPLRTLHGNSFSEGLNNITSCNTSHINNNNNYNNAKSSGPLSSPTANLPDTVKMSQLGEKGGSKLIPETKPLSILSNKIDLRRSNYQQSSADKKDPLAMLAQGGGSKRNALLKWCQSQTLGYTQVDITNFSSSWNDGLAFCAILDTYVPEKINYRTLNHTDKRANFEKALAAAESIGIPSTLDINDMMNSERPNWQTVYNYVTSIYAHFEA